MIKYRITIIESERGYGQRREYEYYKTREQAQRAIDAINKINEDNYKQTGIVPDWYEQAEDKIDLVELDNNGYEIK